MDQLVIRRPQLFMSCILAQTRPVNHRLRVLNTKTDGKGLGLDVHLTLMQHAEGITCAVSQREYDMATQQLAAIRQGHTLDFAILQQQVSDFGLKPNLAPHINDALTHP